METTITLQACKDQVAKKHRFKDWEDVVLQFQAKNYVDEVALLYGESKEPKWIRFEEKKPELNQEIWVVWSSGKYPPELRKWTLENSKLNWDWMLWLAVPNYKPEFKP